MQRSEELITLTLTSVLAIETYYGSIYLSCSFFFYLTSPIFHIHKFLILSFFQIVSKCIVLLVFCSGFHLVLICKERRLSVQLNGYQLKHQRR